MVNDPIQALAAADARLAEVRQRFNAAPVDDTLPPLVTELFTAHFERELAAYAAAREAA